MIVLDTCVLIFLSNHTPLPTALHIAMRDGPWAVSAASAWEVGIKHASGKLALTKSPEAWWESLVQALDLHVLPMTDVIALRAAALPPHHADPFDRAIIATAITHACPIATTDRVFERYLDCGVMLAGR